MANAFPLCSLSVCALLCCLGSTCVANADPAPSHPSASLEIARPVRVELLGGMGFGSAELDTSESINTFGAGASLRSGYSFAFGGNLALRADHFFGSSSSYPMPLVARLDYHRRADYLGLDLGFDLRTSHAVFRPFVGLGGTFFTRNTECTVANSAGFDSLSADVCRKYTESKHTFYPTIAPGLSMHLLIGRFFVILEPRCYYQKSTFGFASMAGLGLTL